MKLGVFAFEQSADQLGATLLKSLPKPILGMGVGGHSLAKQGVKRVYDLNQLNYDFLFPTLGAVLKRRKQFTHIRKKIEAFQPDALLTIDGTNYSLAVLKQLKKLTVPKIHLVSPPFWFWREGRAKSFEHYASHVLCLYPHEASFYKKGFAYFVGHAGLYQLYAALQKNPKPSQKGLGLFIGSRFMEVKYIHQRFMIVAKHIQTVYNIPIVIPTFPQFIDFIRLKCEEYGLEADIIDITRIPISKIFCKISFALAASGTVSLQLGIANIPHIVVYDGLWLFYIALGLLRKTKYINLWNTMANQYIIPEHVKYFTTHTLTKQLMDLIDNKHSMATRQLNQIAEWAPKLLYPNGIENSVTYTTRILQSLLHETS